MFITSQTDLDFGEHHNTAMDASLRKSFFKSLTAPRWQEFKNSYETMQYISLSGHVVSKERRMNELPPPMPRTSLLPEDIDEEEN